MLIDRELAQWCVFPAAGVLTILFLFGFLYVRRKLEGKWYLKFPITFPVLPALLIGSLVAPIVAFNNGTQVILIKADRSDARLLLFGSTNYKMSDGGNHQLETHAGQNAIVLNDSSSPCTIKKVFYGIPMDPENTPVPPGGMASYDSTIDAVGPPDQVSIGKMSRIYVVLDGN